ncbi:Glycosyltransferase involved in cell wall bisynthesis [Hyunsoonleella jejuensis]|uniref:Glycosyltransferase involved in cell wall bisynthesis n=1 Tax=Hyunsoonleella jejuensis TaxID=419940 RepID=A0A1H9AZT3_9FLAO|nr:glycosyltransferase family 4 protein [Hyunsoonleella jejuensis]SEP81943.1 Glycosyltransferase involved in cell wall bisynthesis [Hyunsoonleella jejuensis]
MKNKVLFLGNVPGSDPRSIGGASTYTYELLEEITNKDNIAISFLPIRKRWYKGGQIIDYFFLIIKLPFHLFKHDVVSIHASWDFHVSAGPFVVLFSRMLNKKIIYHFFGGNFHKMYQKYPWILRRWLDVTIFKAKFKLVETKRMISFFEKKTFNGFVWFPNSRKVAKVNFKNEGFNNRFVFISRVTPTKGINVILEVSKSLPKNYIIDIYGPLDSKYYTADFFQDYSVEYKGTLKPNEVLNTLSKYDVLLLPTFYSGEGYPGIIIEAMSLGKPIICSKWNALDELVEDNVNGKLIESRSIEDLKNAINDINKDNYQYLSDNSKKRFSDFNIDNVAERLVKLYLEDD